MINKVKLLSKIEDKVYSSENKVAADKLMKKYISLINCLTSTDYRITVVDHPFKLIIKHKAFNKKLVLSIINNESYLDKEIVQPKDIQKKLDLFFLTKK